MIPERANVRVALSHASGLAVNRTSLPAFYRETWMTNRLFTYARAHVLHSTHTQSEHYASLSTCVRFSCPGIKRHQQEWHSNFIAPPYSRAQKRLVYNVAQSIDHPACPPNAKRISFWVSKFSWNVTLEKHAATKQARLLFIARLLLRILQKTFYALRKSRLTLKWLRKTRFNMTRAPRDISKLY